MSFKAPFRFSIYFAVALDCPPFIVQSLYTNTPFLSILDLVYHFLEIVATETAERDLAFDPKSTFTQTLASPLTGVLSQVTHLTRMFWFIVVGTANFTADVGLAASFPNAILTAEHNGICYRRYMFYCTRECQANDLENRMVLQPLPAAKAFRKLATTVKRMCRIESHLQD